MKKEETINKYLEAFLEGKNDSEREEFCSRPLERRYAAVMAWKRRRNLKTVAEQSDATAILGNLKQLRQSIEAARDLNDNDIQRISDSIDQLKEGLSVYIRRRDLREIEILSRKQSEIEERLAMLRSRTTE